MVKNYELTPTGRQKSFYGKAIIMDYSEDTGNIFLRSYSTVVCCYNVRTKEFNRIYGGYSATTMRHIDSFRNNYGLNNIGKHMWESLEVNKDIY